MKYGAAALYAAFMISLSPAGAQTVAADKFRISAEEMSACGADAIALCSYAYPDEDKLLSCMKVNRVNLSASCRPVFDAGVRRRHL